MRFWGEKYKVGIQQKIWGWKVDFIRYILVGEVLVCDISNYGNVSIPPFALLQNTAFNSSVLRSQIASTPFTSEVILGQKSALYSNQGLR